MSIELQKCTFQFLKSIFSPLDNFTNHVFWIRNYDDSQQIYISSGYEHIWQREPAILFDIPLVWLDYLAKDNQYAYMKQLQDRHVLNYLDLDKNFVFYQISRPNQQIEYLTDRCFKCRSKTGIEYVVGVSSVLSADKWHEQYRKPPRLVEEQDITLYKLFFDILKRSFGLSIISQLTHQSPLLHQFRSYAVEEVRLEFTKRELQCLRHFCLGKTYKETARDMAISPRTVETHLENILRKSDCTNKFAMISRFAKYFVDPNFTPPE